MRREPWVTSENGSLEDEETDRIAGQGEADEPDAPTAGEENEGMSTILDSSPMTGVQEDAGDE